MYWLTSVDVESGVDSNDDSGVLSVHAFWIISGRIYTVLGNIISNNSIRSNFVTYVPLIS